MVLTILNISITPIKNTDNAIAIIINPNAYITPFPLFKVVPVSKNIKQKKNTVSKINMINEIHNENFASGDIYDLIKITYLY
tara:strand:+ start:153 stop:398 length:246 start_codon:yes stop_codon:yes gene_type:complete